MSFAHHPSRLPRFAIWRLLLALLLAGTALAGPVDFIPLSTPWRYLKGTAEATQPVRAAWRQIGFQDTSWTTGVLPIFYGEPLSGTVLGDMRNNYSSVYLRREFTVQHPEDVELLSLQALCDDGFIAWINGVEVARFNVPGGDLPFNAFALVPAPEPATLQEFGISNPTTLLQEGVNVLSVHLFNVNLTSSDIVFDARLHGVIDDSPPTLVQVIPANGALVWELPSVEVQFSESVVGVDAEDLLFNDNPATQVEEVSPGQFVFEAPVLSPGPITVRFVEDHGITDTSHGALPFSGATWSYILDPEAPRPTLLITEFLASNDQGIRDEDGDESDWIEIYNASQQLINLAGWTLTDDAQDPQQWTFPSLFLAPNTYLLVWASGKDRAVGGSPLHTSFSLSRDGEYLGLLNPAGEAVSDFAPFFPVQYPDTSYGRAQGAFNVVGYFLQPTPGKQNSVSGPGFAPAVTFSEVSRTYSGSLTVTLDPYQDPDLDQMPPPNTVIRYTLDGTVPTESSPEYTVPFVFENVSVRLRARAFAPGYFPGPVHSESYICLSLPVSLATSDLPIVVIHNFNQGRPPADTMIPADILVFEPGENGRTSLTNSPTLRTRAGIRARGSSTLGYPKVSLRVEFWDEADEGLNHPVLGMPSDDDWIFYAPNNFEPSMIHNPFMHQLSRDVGRYSPRTRFCEVYMVTTGTDLVRPTHYNGVYVILERIEPDADRVDIDRLLPEDIAHPEVTGGYLMKIDRLAPGERGLNAAGMNIALANPDEAQLFDPARAAQRSYIQTYLDSFRTALDGANYRNPVTGYRAFVDTASWIDHHLLNVLAFNVDALRLSTYFYKPREGKLEFGPLWDFDRALGSTDGRDSNPRVWRATTGDLGTDFFNFPWWSRLFTDPDFFQEYIDRYQELRRTHFSDDNLRRLTDELANEVRESHPRELSRWGVQPRGGSFQSEINFKKSWLVSRTDFMDSQFVEPPEFTAPDGVVEPGFLITLDVPGGVTAHYTLDGSDPRAPGGAVSPSAQTYSGPFQLNQNARITVRSRNLSHQALTGPNNPPLSSPWSGRFTATYIVEPLPLILSEIMFRPLGDADARRRDYEFVELLNRGTETIDLTGVRFEGTDGGAFFTFSPSTPTPTPITTLEPGERVLLVNNLERFTERYPDIDQIAGEYPERLHAQGDTLRLIGPLDEVIFEVRYEPDWQPLADGEGHSLVPIDENLPVDAYTSSAAWVASAALFGSPGELDPASSAEEILIQIGSSDGGTLEVNFNARSNSEYLLEARDLLTEGTWTIIETFGPFETTSEVRHPLDASGQARYFRVRTNGGEQ